MLRELAPELAAVPGSSRLPRLPTSTRDPDRRRRRPAPSRSPRSRRSAPAAHARRAWPSWPAGSSSTTRSTSSSPAAPPARPRAPRSPTTTSSTTASSSARRRRLAPEDRVCIPVPLYHCFGMVLGNLACLTHGAAMVYPGGGFDPLAVLQTVHEERCTALYGVPTMFIAELGHPEFASLRPLLPAHRHHGRLALPDRGHAPGGRPRCTWREVTIAYGMTETSPVSFQSSTDDPLERRVSHRRPHPPARRGQDRRRRRPHRPARRPRRAVHPRLLGDARLLGRPGAHRRGHRRRPLDAHRRPRHHRRGGLLQHRRPDQGHGDPRRREHLPARGRGVPLRPPRGPRRAVLRRARRDATARSCAPRSS